MRGCFRVSFGLGVINSYFHSYYCVTQNSSTIEVGYTGKVKLVWWHG